MLRTITTLTLLTILTLALLVPHNTDVFAKSKQQKTIDAALKKLGWPNLCIVGATTKTNNVTQIVYDAHCVNNPGPDPNPNPTPNVIPKLNKTTTFRVGVVGDVDSNNGLVTQLNLMTKYQAQGLILPGDFEYTNGQGVLAKLTAAGFNKSNTDIILGNHDKCSDIKSWMQSAECFGDKFLGGARVDVFAIVGKEKKFDCSETQFTQIKSDLESSDAWYNIPVIHQPFVTGPSNHPANGGFDCWNALFKANGVKLVLQAHNHNYQRFVIDGITYLVVGTGTHDSGSKMYSISSSAKFNGVTCAKCFTGTNGVLFLDFKIDSQHTLRIDAYFVSNADKLMDTFTVS